MEKTGICILGSTGSIGQNTLEIIKLHSDRFEVVALSAATSIDKLFEQCCLFKPQFAVMVDKEAANHLKRQLQAAQMNTKVLSGTEGLSTITQLPEVKKVIAAIVGASGLIPMMSAAKAGKQILLANKEALVMAGDLFITTAKQHGACILPVDSEHNALFQCMPAGYCAGTRPKDVQKLILTASGGPFLHMNKKHFDDITPEMACHHPNWKMGKKITVDCASLMNKGLE
ncbi:MAG: 1-deoxy-D-xylulose-5-phosphate reductoisomerase, partial [Candidatus Paceibacterales bacterium]